ncbi:hypothetical protein [Cognatishimia sp. F0-27]|uniref:hypothetical protein n=1 Tax=Cognatishimia sp. F0-27 TaxID=2816855 RepID=UPI001D0C4108|nr:hypothetical protein [Cognatishimia sp. F0-27]MCC1491386.1 hypothetical protein [Cognatishimia sp. F0-27]
MLTGLALPTLLLMIAAVLITRLIERVVPESGLGLATLGVVSSLVLWLVAGALFATLYLGQDSRLAALLASPEGIVHFLALGAKAALIWAPLVGIVTITAPQRWKTNRW